MMHRFHDSQCIQHSRKCTSKKNRVKSNFCVTKYVSIKTHLPIKNERDLWNRLLTVSQLLYQRERVHLARHLMQDALRLHPDQPIDRDVALTDSSQLESFLLLPEPSCYTFVQIYSLLWL